MSAKTPNLEDVIIEGAKTVLASARTILVGEVVSYDPDTSSADVKPVVNMQFKDGSSQEYPVIQGLPVVFPEFGNFTITSDLTKGQHVLILVNERSLDEWVTTGQSPVTAQDPRRFDLQDGCVLAGIRPYNDSFETTSDLVIGNGNVAITLTADGKVKIGTGTTDLLGLISDLLTALQASTVTTAAGPMPLLNAAQFGTIKGKLANIKGA